ncbi:MAG TPA: class E sortase, partial [Acidimicrobiales bacterium]|nr:class E sortase [Acidimicrobiales bacterium]
MRLARVLSGVGRLLIWAGALVLLFVAYQLWGTGLAEARAQDDLADDFAALLDATDTTAPSTTTSTTVRTPSRPSRPTTTTTTPPPPPPEDGSAVARIVIPKIGVDKIVVEGVGRRDLQKGPGHYPGTPLPGQPGNAAIAGHRTTFGAPFQDVDELVPGDEILVTTRQGSFRYEVTGTQIVLPNQVEVVEDQGDDRLTLTSCHPLYSARERIVVSAELVDDPAPAPPPSEPADPVDELPDEEPEDDEVEDDPVVDADIEHLDGEDTRTAGPALRWGAVAAAVWLAFFVLSRRWRRWPAYLLGAPVFAVALFVFFGALTEA